MLQAHIAGKGVGFWAAEIRDGREFIGFIGIPVPRATFPFSPCVEIGWRLAFRFWRQGYATEGARGSLRIGFDVLGLDEIVSFAVANNRRSLAVMQRLGMREDPATFEHPGIAEGYSLRTHRLYRLTRANWLDGKPEKPAWPERGKIGAVEPDCGEM